MKLCSKLFIALALVTALPFISSQSTALSSHADSPVAPVFAEGDIHISTLEYLNYFQAHTAVYDSCTLSIESKIYDDDMATELYEKVITDHQVIASALSSHMDTYRIYVVDKLVNGSIQREGNIIYCTIEDIRNGTYHESLVSAALDINDRWKSIGLAAFFFGDAPDTDFLRTYYEEAKDMDILSFFPAYFIDLFAEDTELEIARSTATSFTCFIAEKYGLEEILSTDSSMYVNEWLSYIGVEKMYEDTYKEVLSRYTYSSTPKYPLVAINTRQDTIYIGKPRNDWDLDSPWKVRRFLYEIAVGMETILERIAVEAPVYYERIMVNYEAPIIYEIDSTHGSATDAIRRKIHLDHSFTFYHETLHLCIPPIENGFYTRLWLYESIAEYFALTYYPDSYFHKERYYQYLTNPEGDTKSKYSAEIVALGGKCTIMTNETYLKYARAPETMDDVDFRLYNMASAETQFFLPPEMDLKPVIHRVHEATTITIMKNNGNELTYAQGAVFTDYLIEKTSLDTYLSCCFDDVTFDDAFGMSYDEAKEDWLAGFLND